MKPEQTVRNRRNIRTKEKMSYVRIFSFSAMISLITGLIFMVVYFIGEQTNILPTIEIGELDYGKSGDPIVLYIFSFMFSIFVGSFITLWLINKKRAY